MTDLHLVPIGNAIWRAGAGAGKTYNLVERVLRMESEWRRLPDSNGLPPRLLVTTFTRMATQELRVRLMEAALRSPRQAELVPFVTSRSQLFVTTMHGVMDSYLRTFGTAIGLEAGFRVAGPDEMDTLVRRVGKRVFFPEPQISGPQQSILDEVLAEYGFASALTIIQRLSKLRREFAAIDNDDRTLRAANAQDFEHFISKLLQSQSASLKLLVGEIEGHQNSDRWNIYIDWLNEAISILNRQETIASRLKALSLWLDREPAIRNAGTMKIEFAAGVKWKDPIRLIEKSIEDSWSDLNVIEKFESLNQSILAIESEYTKLLRAEKLAKGLIELEDLEIFAIELLRHAPQTATAYAESWDHWLIDEYQDTSPRQVSIIRQLARGKPQFVVGDPQQSIYLFRGARPGVFHDRESAATTQGHERMELMGNRRSHPEVMAFINQVVEGLGPPFQKMSAVRGEQSEMGRRPGSVGSPLGGVAVYIGEPLLEKPSVQTASGAKEKPLPQDEQKRAEASRLVAVALQLLQAGASPASIAVLARSNRELTYVARELMREGLPIQLHTAGAYSDRLETADLCALVVFLANPHDDENLIHLARTPWFPVDESVLARGYRRSGSLWSVLENLLSSNEVSAEQKLMIQGLRTALICVNERGVVQAFRELLTTCEFFSWCGVLDPSGRREANALKFLTKLVVAERQAGFSPRKFCDEVLGGGERGGEGDSSDRDAVAAVKPDRIHLMTIHVSKGLEFDHVIVPFLADSSKKTVRVQDKFVFHETELIWSAAVSTDEEGSFSAGPISRDWNATVQAWSLEESRRLLYVALTRARESIFLSATLGSEELPPEESFLSYLNLNRTAGTHDTYKVLGSEPKRIILPKQNQDALVSVPLPWKLPNASMNTSPRISMSVTALVERDQMAKALLGDPSNSTSPLIKIEISEEKQKPLKMAEAAARGTRLHRVFEMAKAMVGDRQETMAKEIARWFPANEQADALLALKWTFELKAPDLASIAANGEVEWSFTYVHPSEPILVEGQIDLWGHDKAGKLWIVDYKTGNSEYADKAFAQLRYYAQALLAAGVAKPGQNLGLAAVFPFAQLVFVNEFTVE